MKAKRSSYWALSDADLKRGNFAGTVHDYASLASWLVTELETALSARPPNLAQDIAYRWTYYEQGRTRGGRMPWPNAADLTSPYATEFVDAILGRIMDAVRGDPMWIVEGWGESAKKAAFVEEFHQRTAEQERLVTVLSEVILRALIEPCGVLEVNEPTMDTRTRKTITARVQQDDLGRSVFGPDGQPIIAQDAQGNPVQVDPSEPAETDPATGQPLSVPTAEVEVDVVEPMRVGPGYDVIPYLDYLRFPGHARNSQEVWGYAKRFWRRVPQLTASAAKGMYDPAAVEAIGTADERGLATTGTEMPFNITVDQRGPTAQKELWEIPFLADLDGQGERWYLATLSREHTRLLRLVVDDRTTRFIEFTTMRKPGSLDGYSLVEKMLTLVEEDTAVRNMRADKAALAISAPIKRVAGALWDPFEQPFAPGAVIDVRDMAEVQQMVLADVPQSINVWKMDVRSDLERLIGMNDVSVGTQTQERRTLGEVQLAAGYSEVRVRMMLSSIQEGLEELAQVRHDIWKRTLRQQERGLPIPQSMMQALDARGLNVESITSDGRVTAEMLEGQFWFKARGSTELANLDRQAQLMTGLLAEMTNMAKVNPLFAVALNTPEATHALIEQMLRVARWPDKSAFLGPAARQAMEAFVAQKKLEAETQQQQAQMQSLMAHPVINAMHQLAASAPPQEPSTGPAPPTLPAPGVM